MAEMPPIRSVEDQDVDGDVDQVDSSIYLRAGVEEWQTPEHEPAEKPHQESKPLPGDPVRAGPSTDAERVSEIAATSLETLLRQSFGGDAGRRARDVAYWVIRWGTVVLLIEIFAWAIAVPILVAVGLAGGPGADGLRDGLGSWLEGRIVVLVVVNVITATSLGMVGFRYRALRAR